MDLQERHVAQEDGCDLSPNDYIKASQKKVMEKGNHSTLPPALREGNFWDRLAEETTLRYSDLRWGYAKAWGHWTPVTHSRETPTSKGILLNKQRGTDEGKPQKEAGVTNTVPSVLY